MMDTQTIISTISLLGVGGIIGAVLKDRLEKRKVLDLQRQDFKFGRYKVIILLLYSAVYFDDYQLKKLRDHGRDFSTVDELIEELRAEWHNMILFASDEVLKAMQLFIGDPSKENFNEVALAIRRDLWGHRKTSFKFDVDRLE